MLERYELIKPDKTAEGFTELELYPAKEQAKAKSNAVAMRKEVSESLSSSLGEIPSFFLGSHVYRPVYTGCKSNFTRRFWSSKMNTIWMDSNINNDRHVLRLMAPIIGTSP